MILTEKAVPRLDAVVHSVMGEIMHDSCRQRQTHRHACNHRQRLDNAVVTTFGIVVDRYQIGPCETRDLVN